MNMSAKYPKIIVPLIGKDGNAFAIIGAVTGALRKNKVPADEISEFTQSAMSGDYDNLLRSCTEWVTIQ